MLNNAFKEYNHLDSLSSPDTRSALDRIHKEFVVVPIDKATGNITLICKRFYASVIAKELRLGNSNSTKTYNSINNLTADTIINNNINGLKSKFGIDNIATENHCLSYMYLIPKMHKNPIQDLLWLLRSHP